MGHGCARRTRSHAQHAVHYAKADAVSALDCTKQATLTGPQTVKHGLRNGRMAWAGGTIQEWLAFRGNGLHNGCTDENRGVRHEDPRITWHPAANRPQAAITTVREPQTKWPTA